MHTPHLIIKMGYELFISLRYLIARRKERFISIITLISVLGVAVGVMALIIVIAVMSGFDRDLADKITGLNSHIIVEKDGGISNPVPIMDELERFESVQGAAPYIAGQAMVVHQDRVTAVVLRGIDPVLEVGVSKIGEFLSEGALSFEINKAGFEKQKLDFPKKGFLSKVKRFMKEKRELGGIVIGKELAGRLGVGIGDSLFLISPSDASVNSFKVTGIFNSGMFEYDVGVLFVSIKDALIFFGTEGLLSGIGVRVRDSSKVMSTKRILEAHLGGWPYTVRTWMELNSSLFSALKLEKTVMFIILALITMVASFNIASTLIMMVTERTKDIGILKALGATQRSIRRIFTFEGLIIGIAGIVLGGGVGILLVLALEKYKFIRLPADIYYVDTLPVAIQWNDITMVLSFALVLCLCATIYPAYKASKLSPVDALRYE